MQHQSLGPFACLYIPQFTLRTDAGSLRGPVAAADKKGIIIEVSPSAWNQGVRPGQRKREALGHCGTLALVEVALEDAQQAFEPALALLDQYSPEVEGDRPGRAYIGLSGLASLYGSIEKLARLLLDVMPDSSREVARLGIGPNKFVAWAAARQAEAGGWLMVSKEEASAFVAPLHVTILPLTPGDQHRPHLFGIRNLGHLREIGLSALQAQFGPLGKRLWEWSRGEDSTPLVPRRQKEFIEERLVLAAPTADQQALLAATRVLLQRAFGRKERLGRSVRHIELALVLDSGHAERLRVPLKEAMSSAEVAWMPLRYRLERLPQVARPVEELRLILQDFSGESGKQNTLFNERRHQEQLAEAVRQLRAQHPNLSLGYVVEIEPWSRLKERQAALADYVP